MADIENQLQFATSQPQEAAKNINESRLFNLSPDEYKKNKDLYATEADILQRTSSVTKGVAAYSSQSPEHTALVKNDLKPLSQIDAIFSKSMDDVKGVSLEQEVNNLKSKRQSDPAKFTDDDVLALYEKENQLRERQDHYVEMPRKNDEVINKYLETRQSTDLFDQMLKGVGSVASSNIANTSQIPSLLYDAYFYPANLIRSLRGEPEITAPEALTKNPVYQKYNEMAKSFNEQAPLMTADITRLVSEGNFEEAGKALAVQSVAQIPNLAGLIAASIIGGPAGGAAFAGAQTSAQKNVENQDKGITPTQSLPNAVTNGVIEAAMERVGTIGVFNKLSKSLSEKFGKDSAKKIMFNMFSAITESTVQNAKEEGLTTLGQKLTDYTSGVDKGALDNIVNDTLNSVFIGGATGGFLTGPGAIVNAKVQSDSVRVFNENQQKAVKTLNFIDDMRNFVSEFKNTEVGKSTEAAKYLETTFKDKGLDNVYMNLEDAQAFATDQTKGQIIRNLVDPTGKAAAAINAPLRFKAHEFFAITMEYPELLDSVKLSPEAATAKQASEFLNKVQEADQKRMAVFDKLQAPEQTPEDIKMIQEALNPEQPSAIYPSSDVFGEREYLDLTDMEKAVTPFLSKGERTKFLADQKASRQEIVNNINESAQYEMDQVMDIAMVELMDIEKEAQLQRLENNPDLALVDKFTKNIVPDQYKGLEEFQAPHHKEGYSLFAIDPRTLPDELKVYEKDKRIKQNKVFVKGGIDVNLAASLLGVSDAATLLKTLADTPTREEIANMRAENRRADIELEAKDKIGLNEVGIQKAYDARLTNALETMKIMKDKFWSSTKTGIKGLFFNVSLREVTSKAKETITKSYVKDLNVNQFKVGERRSDRMVWDAITKNQVEKAYRNQYATVQNIALQKETQLAIGEVNRAIKFFRKFNKATTINELKEAGPIYHDAAMNILESLNLTTKTSTKDLKDSFKKYVESVGRDSKTNLVISEGMLDQRLELPDMTVEQVRAVKEELTRILHQAKFKNKLFSKFEKIEGIQTVEHIANKINEKVTKIFDYNPKKAESLEEYKLTFFEKKAEGLLKLNSQLERTQHIIKKLDDGKVNGFFNDLFWRPLVKSGDNYRNLIAQTDEHHQNLIEAFGKKEWENLASEFVTPEEFKNTKIGRNGKVSKLELFAMELNFGNEGNLKELEKFGVDRGTIRKVLDRELTDKHTALAQNFRDVFESFKPKIQELEKRTEGMDNVKWVEAVPYVARGKEIPGGYYPIFRASDELKIKSKELAGAGPLSVLDRFKQNYYGKAMTETGHLESRTGNDDLLSLNFANYGKAVNQVIHDLIYRETIADGVKLLSDKSIRESIASVVGKHGYKNLADTYINVANEVDRQAKNDFLNALGKLTNGVQVVAIAGKLSSVLVQPASLGLAINEMGPKGIQYMGETAALISQNIDKYSEIVDFAEQINPSIAKFTEDIKKNGTDTLNDIVPTKKTKGLDPLIATRDFITDNSFRALGEVDKINKIIVTISAFKQAMEGNAPGLEHLKGDYEGSVKYASNMVELTQTSNQTRNLAPIQLNEVGKLFTLFYNDLNNVHNAIIGTYRRTMGEFNKGNYAKTAASGITFLMVMTAMKLWENLVRGQKIPGDKDEEGKEISWSNFMLNQTSDIFYSGIPVLRDAKYAYDRYASDKAKYGDKASFKPVNIPLYSAVSDLTLATGGLFAYLDFVITSKGEGTLTKNEKRAMWNSMGFLSGLPTGAFYNYFIREKSDAELMKKDLTDRITEKVRKIVNNPDISNDFKEKLQAIDNRLNPKAVDLPKESYNIIKEMISESNPYAYNEKTGAAGVYQFTESVWNKLMNDQPNLGLTENGRVSKDTTQQQKAFEFISKQSSEYLQAAGLEVNAENIYASYLMGPLKAVEVLSADDKTKINTLVDNKILTDNEIDKNMTVAEFKDWLLIKSVSAEERLTKKTNK